MTIVDEINELLEASDNLEYTNMNEVQFDIEDEETFSASSDLLVVAHAANTVQLVKVELFCEKKMFVNRLELNTLADLEAITPGNLLQLYETGKAEMICFIDQDFTNMLAFYKSGDNTIAKDDHNFEHEVNTVLAQPEDYIHYTLQYYKMIQAYSEN